MSSRPELTVDDEGGFIQFFNRLPAPGDDTIRLFDRGDWYSAHGSDAKFIALHVYKSTSVIRHLGRNDASGLPSVTMTATVYRQFLRDCLTELGKRIEIWASEGRMNWRRIKQASPGNFQDVEEDLVGQFDSAPMMLAVKISTNADGTRGVGVCFADASVRELGVSEFIDNDLYSNFESLVIQLGVKECIIQNEKADGDKDAELAKLRLIIDNCGMALTRRPAGEFGIRDIEQDLTRILKDERSANLLPQADLKLAMGSASALIKYLGILQDPTNFGQYRLYQHDLSHFMKLDAAALKALDLFPGRWDGSNTTNLFGALNHCKTQAGSRLLSRWLKQPLLDKAEIEKRQQLVTAFVEDTQLRQALQEQHLRFVPDLYRLSKRFQRKKANLEDVVRAYQVVIRISSLIDTLADVMDETHSTALEEAYTTKLRGIETGMAKLRDMVESTVDLEALDRHEYIIKSEFDDRMRLVRKRMQKVRDDMEAEFRDVADDLSQEIDKKIFLENTRMHGMCMRLTRMEAGCIRNNSRFQECSTQKNGVYFTTKKLQALRREHDQLSEQYASFQSGLVDEIITVAATYCPPLERLAGVLAHLDVIVSFAHCSVNAPTSYVRPKIHPRGEGQTVLKEARHPCMELQDDIHFITNDVVLARDKSSFIIITGPNMGGKSTYIRQVGVIALMAQIGCFVPCTEAELTIFDSILARVGAGDSQLKGISTFMGEMVETANILRSATAESLVIIDELGRGTSTYDGFGIAWAIAEHLVKQVRCFGLFATHFHELTSLENQYPCVENVHVTVHVGGKGEAAKSEPREVTHLYKVRPGACDDSFGIHVAELCRFPEKVIRMARREAQYLEGFKHKQADSGPQADYSKEDIAESSMLLKDVLGKWREAVKEGHLSHEEMVGKMKEMVLADAKLLSNPYFQSIKSA